jgi:hypothetical protein
MDKAVVNNLVENGKHFCVLPWVHFHAWPDSRVMPCCVADSNMPVAKIDGDQSIIEMMNSEDYKELRRKMMDDEPVEGKDTLTLPGADPMPSPTPAAVNSANKNPTPSGNDPFAAPAGGKQ